MVVSKTKICREVFIIELHVDLGSLLYFGYLAYRNVKNLKYCLSKQKLVCCLIPHNLVRLNCYLPLCTCLLLITGLDFVRVIEQITKTMVTLGIY